MVERGDVAAAIVYATDAVAARSLVVLDRADPGRRRGCRQLLPVRALGARP
jgi:hypothetical protein